MPQDADPTALLRWIRAKQFRPHAEVTSSITQKIGIESPQYLDSRPLVLHRLVEQPGACPRHPHRRTVHLDSQQFVLKRCEPPTDFRDKQTGPHPVVLRCGRTICRQVPTDKLRSRIGHFGEAVIKPRVQQDVGRLPIYGRPEANDTLHRSPAKQMRHCLTLCRKPVRPPFLRDLPSSERASLLQGPTHHGNRPGVDLRCQTKFPMPTLSCANHRRPDEPKYPSYVFGGQ